MYLYRFTDNSKWHHYLVSKMGQTDLKINGKNVWSRDYWKELYESSKKINIWNIMSFFIKNMTLETILNNIADKLTRGEIRKGNFSKVKENVFLNLRTMRFIQPRCHQVFLLKRWANILENQERTCREVPPGGMLDLHKALGHSGTQACRIQLGRERELEGLLAERRAVQTCEGCTQFSE